MSGGRGWKLLVPKFMAVDILATPKSASALRAYAGRPAERRAGILGAPSTSSRPRTRPLPRPGPPPVQARPRPLPRSGPAPCPGSAPPPRTQEAPEPGWALPGLSRPLGPSQQPVAESAFGMGEKPKPGKVQRIAQGHIAVPGVSASQVSAGASISASHRGLITRPIGEEGGTRGTGERVDSLPATAGTRCHHPAASTTGMCSQSWGPESKQWAGWGPWGQSQACLPASGGRQSLMFLGLQKHHLVFAPTFPWCPARVQISCFYLFI